MRDNTAEKLPELPQLTSLRFFAAFAVVVLHYRDLLGPLPVAVRALIVGGQYGVTFFFVLSGFILTYKYETWFEGGVRSDSFWKFQKYRFAKIYPIYLLGLLLDTPWQFIAHIYHGSAAGKGLEYWASWLINALGMQSWIPGIPYTLVWNTPAWSVSSEFFFYLTFPWICYVLASKVRSAAWMALMLAALLVISALIYAAVVHALYVMWDLSWDVRYSVQHYTPLLRLPEFIAGCMAGQIFLGSRRVPSSPQNFLFGSQWRRNGVLMICLALILWRVLTPPYTGPVQELWLIDNAVKFSIFVLPFIGIIFAVASGPTLLSTPLSWPLMVLLGEASYALYITHWTGQSVMQMGFMAAYKSPAMSVAFIFLSVVMSVLLFKYFETPMRLKLRGKST
jgi:peptidoglycan/LPS O-acetylase OafA/YrhL